VQKHPSAGGHNAWGCVRIAIRTERFGRCVGEQLDVMDDFASVDVHGDGPLLGAFWVGMRHPSEVVGNRRAGKSLVWQCRFPG